jgi:hypothetical protein
MGFSADAFEGEEHLLPQWAELVFDLAIVFTLGRLGYTFLNSCSSHHGASHPAAGG